MRIAGAGASYDVGQSQQTVPRRVVAPKLDSGRAFEGGEIKRVSDGCESGEIVQPERAERRVDIRHADGASDRAVAAPQFAAMHAVVRREIEDAIDIGQVCWR